MEDNTSFFPCGIELCWYDTGTPTTRASLTRGEPPIPGTGSITLSMLKNMRITPCEVHVQERIDAKGRKEEGRKKKKKKNGGKCSALASIRPTTHTTEASGEFAPRDFRLS